MIVPPADHGDPPNPPEGFAGPESAAPDEAVPPHLTPPEPPDLSPRPFRFTGSAGEYFRIWIVNLALSIATLGIYSAWAKVRRLRYFYGHTSVNGDAFGYHASPIAILKGRLLAYAVVVTLAVLGQVAPLAASALYLPLVMVMPIVLVRAYRFRAANSSYRGIRFGFDGLEAEAYRLFLFLPIAVPFTLGLAYPYIAKCQREFFVGGNRYGQVGFSLSMPTWLVYRIYLTAAVVTAVWFGVMIVSVAGEDLTVNPEELEERGFAIVLLLYAGLGLVYVGLRTAFENLVWNNTSIDEHRFESRLATRHMYWLYATNILAIAATAGLAVPWARVRMAAYRADSLTLLPGGPIQGRAAIGGAEHAAGSAELGDAMDFDIGL